MNEIMLLNPRRKAKRRRKMSALQAQYFGGGRKRRRSGRSRSRTAVARVARSRPRRARRATLAMNINPRRHRRRRRLSFRRNPIGSGGTSFRSFTSTMKPALVGAGGALAVDMLWAQVAPSLPASLTTGYAAPMVRLGGAFVVGMLAGKIGGRSFGNDAMAGAMVVTLYDLIKPYLAQSGVPMSRYVGGGMRGLNRYVGGGMRGLGYAGAGRVAGGMQQRSASPTRVF